MAISYVAKVINNFVIHTVCMTAFDGLTVMSKWWVGMGLVSTQNWLVGKYFISEKLPPCLRL
ncbi:hypothetical protein CBG57_11695 [Prevotella nigrescens]|uniref:hypothetical protein n=1 Tax=Prevotella nigrescens TaxID=28133 RepID=UPI000B65E26F|nr:hypothetical protein [Prevotella nigrescens]OWP29026.1 hypothetical protein CBG57_11695 [Prevotella nigrescens]